MESMDPSFPNGIEIFQFKPCDFSKKVAKMEKEEIIFSHNQRGSIVENMIKNVNIVVVY